MGARSCRFESGRPDLKANRSLNQAAIEQEYAEMSHKEYPAWAYWFVMIVVAVLVLTLLTIFDIPPTHPR